MSCTSGPDSDDHVTGRIGLVDVVGATAESGCGSQLVWSGYIRAWTTAIGDGDCWDGVLAVMRLDARTDEIKAARELVATRLRECGCLHLVDQALVLTSELVGNAISHGGPPITVEVICLPDSVRVEVSDVGDQVPSRRSIDLDRPGGMGLVIVANLATRWGVERTDPAKAGKSVWFELATS